MFCWILYNLTRSSFTLTWNTAAFLISRALREEEADGFCILHKGLIVWLLLMNNENSSEKLLCLLSQDVPAVGGGLGEGEGENLLLIPSESESELWKEPRPSFLRFVDVSVRRCVQRTCGTADVPTGCSRKLVCFNPCCHSKQAHKHICTNMFLESSKFIFKPPPSVQV